MPRIGSSLALSLTLAAFACGTSDGNEDSDSTTLTSSGPTSSGEASSGESTDATASDASSSGTSAETSDSSGSETDTGTTGGDDPPPTCHADCSGSGTCMAAQICEGGRCNLGCNDANDCVSGNVCVDFGSGLRCAVGCTQPSDCVLAGGAWDEDNWTCEQGACNYQGCMNDAECSPGQVCRPYSGFVDLLLGYSAPACVPACTTAADCDLGAEPTTADNFVCEDGGCKWVGCLGDDECPGTQTCG